MRPTASPMARRNSHAVSHCHAEDLDVPAGKPDRGISGSLSSPPGKLSDAMTRATLASVWRMRILLRGAAAIERSATQMVLQNKAGEVECGLHW